MRVKSPRKAQHQKILKLARGYRMTKSRLFKVANEAVLHAGQYAFAGRRLTLNALFLSVCRIF